MSANNNSVGNTSNWKLPSPEDIICILKEEDAYTILSLKQGQPDTDTDTDAEPLFTLSRSYWNLSNDDENDLQPQLDEFLIDGPPAHLQPGPRRHVHVLVSTHSGTGLSEQFYNNVLAPLLEELGLSASSEPAQNSSYHLLITQDASSVKTFARELGEASYVTANESNGDTTVSETGTEHTIVLLSGDGGVVDMLNGYASAVDKTAALDPNTELPNLPLIAILPLGTGNALFSSLHKPIETPAAASDLVRGLRTLLRGKAAPLPSFQALFPTGSRTITYSEPPSPIHTSTGPGNSTGSAAEEQTQSINHLYGVVVASYGFHSQLVWESDTPEYRQHGAKRFHMVAAELLRESHAYKATVELDLSSTNTKDSSTRRLDRDEHGYILATLVSNLEKTFCISPASEPLDGQLRLVHFAPVDGLKTMAVMNAAYDGGKHVGMRLGEKEEEGGVGYEEINEIRITTHEEDSRWRKVCIDGTIVEIPAGGRMVVRTDTRRHLSVLVDRRVHL
ncbi:ATP-NAD kinase-like domain-containing protein [Xylaria sp. CBS 124048]|nr:ATP-NAD kinase-like domain-containing protein [Xylaria sp. CBS 124048]